MKVQKISCPAILRQTTAPPKALYAIGNLTLLKQKTAVAIVGSRRATNYGLSHAHKLAKALAQSGVVIVSGLALGIDAAAHRGALEADGMTIAVLGSAIDDFTPHTNAFLARQIIRKGGLILSEYGPKEPTFPANFVFRNRLIAGLAQATVVVEAAEKSGALITAGLALEYNRQVYALPGDVERLNCQGTNRLITEGATCLCDPSVILEDLGLQKQQQIKLPLNDQEKQLVVFLNTGAKTFDKIINKFKIKPAQLLAILLTLELKGIIKKSDDGAYLLTSNNN